MSEHEAPLDTRRPFRRADALQAGITPKTLRGPAYRKLFRSVYVDAASPATPAQRATAALMLFGDEAFASHASAARVYDVPIPTIAAEHVSVTHAKLRRRHEGVEVHVARDARVCTYRGVRVSECTQMFVELAGLIGLVDLVVIGDHLVRRGLATCAGLVAACAATTHRAARAARRAASYVRKSVDSPMETRLRMLLVLAGLPEPEVNLVIRSADGEPLRKYDLSYPAALVIVEYDGRLHVERVAAWESDLDRREAIDDDGWRILVVVSSGIYRDPEQTVMRVWRLLRRRWPDGVPAKLSDEWRAHFPGHQRSA